MKSRALAVPLALLLAAAPARAEAPEVEHQPSPCTLPDKPFTLCATVTDDVQVAKARIYFRAFGEQYYSYVDMVFGGIQYCGTLPAPRAGKIASIEYYVQAIDDEYDAKRTSTYQLQVQPEESCGFAPVETDAAKAGAIVVYATNKKQGKKLDDKFALAGVSFVPLTTN